MGGENRTGLVYSCPIEPGTCEGVRGNTALYEGNANVTNGIGTVARIGRLFPNAFSEGRLFDSTRKLVLCVIDKERGGKLCANKLVIF